MHNFWVLIGYDLAHIDDFVVTTRFVATGVDSTHMLCGRRWFVQSVGRGHDYGRDKGGFRELAEAERCGSYLR